jgi:hypothetical protein
MHPKSNRSPKWLNLLKPIWSKHYSREHNRVHHVQTPHNSKLATGRVKNESGSGVEQIILPSDPIALPDRLDLFLASRRAGSTGARNEIVSICDELENKELMMTQI